MHVNTCWPMESWLKHQQFSPKMKYDTMTKTLFIAGEACGCWKGGALLEVTAQRRNMLVLEEKLQSKKAHKGECSKFVISRI